MSFMQLRLTDVEHTAARVWNSCDMRNRSVETYYGSTNPWVELAATRGLTRSIPAFGFGRLI